MQIKKLLPLALATAASAQEVLNLTSALATKPELSQLLGTLGLFEALVANLAGTPNLTLLAPSNAAFEELTATGFTLNDTDLITAVLQYHVLQGTYYAANVTETPAFIPTLLTNSSYTNVTGGQVVSATAIDGNVIFGSGLLTESTVSEADIAYDKGIVHIIDRFLTVPALVSQTAIAANLTSLVGALIAANLTETVDSTPDVTIFAPTNDAFSNIASALTNASSEDLTSILTYHVVAGAVGYSSALTNTTLTTVNGESVTITIIDGTVYVNSAEVVVADVLVANGVVHVIDNVLNPGNATATPDPAASSQAPAFSDASSVSEVPFTSGVPTPTATVGGGSAASASAASASAADSSSSTSVATGIAMPMKTGAVGAAALFGGAALVLNLQ